MMTIHGFKVIEVPSRPSYAAKLMRKRHRNKRATQPRVKVFLGWVDMIEDGQVIVDEARGTVMANTKTCHRIKQEIEARARQTANVASHVRPHWF